MSSSMRYHYPLVKKRLCNHCDLVVALPLVEKGYKADCPRCRSKLVFHIDDDNRSALIYACCALFMLMIALLYQFVNLQISGTITSKSLLSIPQQLSNDKFTSLGVLFFLCVLVIPLLCQLIIALLSFESSLPKKVSIALLRSYRVMKAWSMAEIFIAGVVVSFVKLANYGDIGLNESFMPYCLFTLLSLRASYLFNPAIVWERIQPMPALQADLQLGKNGIDQQVKLCRCCEAILPLERLHCFRCNQKVHGRIAGSLTKTMSILMTAVLLYLPVNFMSIMTSVSLGQAYPSTIMQGVSYMWIDGDYPIALIIFSASILIPSFKIISLFLLCKLVNRERKNSAKRCAQLQSLYGLVEFVGRWSMIDVFVVIIVSSLVQVWSIVNVTPDFGIVLFASVVVITMISATLFDERLIWDSVEQDNS